MDAPHDAPITILTVEVVDRRRKLVALRDEHGYLILRRLSDEALERGNDNACVPEDDAV